MKIFDFLLKKQWKDSNFYVYIVTTYGFTLNYNKSLQIYIFCVKRQAKKTRLSERCWKDNSKTDLFKF